jgi:hypothetical protein
MSAKKPVSLWWLIPVSAIVLVALTLSACGAPAPTPAPTPTVVPEVLASKAEDIIGALTITAPGEPELQLKFTKEGTYSIGGGSGSYQGAMFDAGKFWFEGTELKFESTDGCLTAQVETIPCIGTYQVYVTRRGDKPALKFVMVEDQLADRKTILHKRTWPLVKP